MSLFKKAEDIKKEDDITATYTVSIKVKGNYLCIIALSGDEKFYDTTKTSCIIPLNKIVCVENCPEDRSVKIQLNCNSIQKEFAITSNSEEVSFETFKTIMNALCNKDKKVYRRRRKFIKKK